MIFLCRDLQGWLGASTSIPVIKRPQIFMSFFVKPNLILDNTSLPLLVQMYCYWHMTPASSPYAVFRASDWNLVVAKPIGLRQCLRIAPKKYCPRSVTTHQRSGTISKKTLLNTHVQLAFAWHVNISIIAATGIAEQFLPVIFTNVLFLMETIWLQSVSVGCSDSRERLDGVPRLLDQMTKEQLALKIAREIYKGKGKLESFHAFHCIRSYFSDLSMDDLEGIAGQYGINTN